MDIQTFSQEELQAKKYGELLRIAKSLGLRLGKRLKTSKLIEVLLEAQSGDSLAEDASTVVEALNDSCISTSSSKIGDESTKPVASKEEEPVPSEEMLSDIQLPEDMMDEEIEPLNDEKQKKENIAPSENEPRSKRRRTRTFDTLEDTKDLSQVKEDKHHRSGTFEVEEEKALDARPSKRKKTSTFEVADVKSASDSTPEDTVVNEDVEENTNQLIDLKKRISSDKQLISSPLVPLDEKQITKRATRSNSFVIEEVETLKTLESKPKTPVVRNRERAVATPAQKAVKTLESKPKTPVVRSRERAVATPARNSPKVLSTVERRLIRSSISASGRKSGMVSGKSSVGTPKSEKKDATTAKIMKPLFTVGRGDSAVKDQKGSGIPRFVTFARKLKVPNFAKIHEKAFNRMEALDEYIDKKKKLAENPGSPMKKPKTRPASGDIFKPTVTSVENVDLEFSSKSPARVRNTPQSKAVRGPRDSVVKSLQKDKRTSCHAKAVGKSPKTVKKTLSPRLKSPTVVSKKSPARTQAPKATPASALSRKNSTVSKATPHARSSNLPRPRKENIPDSSIGKPTSTPGSAHKRREYNPKASISKPVGYAPYKGALKPLNTANVRKQMSEKLPQVKTTKERREHQNKILKGVRFNKRFELQMAKRGINLS